MSNRNKLMSLVLIASVVLSACSDEVENGGRPGKGDHSLSFAVSAPGTNTWTKGDATRAAATPATQELDPIEMQGKVNGETVYLTAEVTEGFPGDNRPMTRGTQISETNKKDLMKTFGVSAYTDQKGTPDYMYNEEATLDTDGYWYPKGKYYWPGNKQLSFYAWYPRTADSLTLTDNAQPGAPEMTYTVPKEVDKQQDVMYAVATGKDDPTTTDGYATTNLEFNHALSAVRFVTGDNMAECTINSISINGVKNIGTYDMKTESWSLQDKTNGFNLTVGTDFDGTADVDITEEGQTFFMIPQTLTSDAVITVNLTIANTPCELFAKLADLTSEWEQGKTYTYHLSTGRISAEVTFFKGVNGTDGNPYTSHNISANGDPFTIDLKYPSSVNKITARLAYEETNTDGTVTYTGFQTIEGLEKRATMDTTSLCMNNLGDPTQAKKDETPFVVQIQVDGRMMMQMPKDPDDTSTQTVFYDPDTDAGKWYTIWRGTMFPPNFMSDTYDVCMSRKDYSSNASLTDAKNGQSQYWEVDENHPTYGKKKWSLPNCFWSANDIHKADILCDMMDNHQCPGNDELYGEKTQNSAVIWTAGFAGSNGSEFWWVIRGKDYGTVWRCYDQSWFLSSAAGENRGNAQMAWRRIIYQSGVRYQKGIK